MRSLRKLEHIKHAVESEKIGTNGFDDITLVHNSLSNVSVSSIDLKTKIGELDLRSPIFINAMTGGGGLKTLEINRALAEIASYFNMAVSVGSQMAALKDKNERATFEIVRKSNPNGVIIANLGSEATVDQAEAAIEMIAADALQIHLNTVQELVMPEGDRDFSGRLNRIEAIVNRVNVPVIVKEVGFGIGKEAALLLKDIGVKIIDVGGYGGTNFSLIENKRRMDELSFFNHWGIPTAIAIIETNEVFHGSIIASGGLQNSLEIVKALSLGSNAVGMAGHLISVLIKKGRDELFQTIENLHNEMVMIMTALGVTTVKELHHHPVVISGAVYHWLEQRGIDTARYAQRRTPVK
ncbi:type 2 isopentenyl-diphosphate Delta-isomerase [Fictibacillus sp. Mic-4]|uniref:type 2 isopentenyl-diphosphate Delta-isomerase n=1 Tax=Fictibacillus TaxID=1329200 RepID=UPI0003F8B9FD|nr:type 2 isopentenyl-diphosphate Delta-isomerase [Fictibacillus gelatini]